MTLNDIANGSSPHYWLRDVAGQIDEATRSTDVMENLNDLDLLIEACQGRVAALQKIIRKAG